MAKIRVPHELFVTFREDNDTVQDIDPATGLVIATRQVPYYTGYALEHRPHTQTGASQRTRQLQWAYGSRGATEKYPGYWMLGATREYDWQTRSYRDIPEEPLDPKRAPQVWKNEPIAGFKLTSYASRYSTANKFIVVDDPRGGRFEISIQGFIELVPKINIVHGVIQEALVWSSAKKLLIP